MAGLFWFGNQDFIGFVGGSFGAGLGAVVQIVLKASVGDQPVAADLAGAGDKAVFGGVADGAAGDGLANLSGVGLGLGDGHLIVALSFDRPLSADLA